VPELSVVEFVASFDADFASEVPAVGAFFSSLEPAEPLVSSLFNRRRFSLEAEAPVESDWSPPRLRFSLEAEAPVESDWSPPRPRFDSSDPEEPRDERAFGLPPRRRQPSFHVDSAEPLCFALLLFRWCSRLADDDIEDVSLLLLFAFSSDDDDAPPCRRLPPSSSSSSSLLLSLELLPPRPFPL